MHMEESRRSWERNVSVVSSDFAFQMSLIVIGNVGTRTPAKPFAGAAGSGSGGVLGSPAERQRLLPGSAPPALLQVWGCPPRTPVPLESAGADQQSRQTEAR